MEIDEIPSGKVCTLCNQYKLLTEFDLNKMGKYGHASRCRICRKLNDGIRDAEGYNDLQYHLNSNIQQLQCTGLEALDILVKLKYNPDLPIYPQFKDRMREKGVDVSGW